MNNKLITLPNPSLRKVSADVKEINDKILGIIKDMEESTLDWDQSREHEVGVALAAVQINKLYRIVILRDDHEDKYSATFTIFINPEIEKSFGDIVMDYEGCLSIPDIYGKVPRYNKVKVKALDTNLNKIELTASGFLARVFQHEIDHTNGIVFIDHIKDNPDAFYILDTSGKLIKQDYEQIKKNERSLCSSLARCVN